MYNKLWAIYTHCFNNNFMPQVKHWVDNKLNARSFLCMTVILTCGKRVSSVCVRMISLEKYYFIKYYYRLLLFYNISDLIHNTRRGNLIWGWTVFYVLLFQIILGGAGCTIWSNLCAYFVFWWQLLHNFMSVIVHIYMVKRKRLKHIFEIEDKKI